MKIIGIGGTNGSGKDTIGQMLAERHGWMFISITDILRDELKTRGKSIERHNLRSLSKEWNEKHGPGVMTNMAVEQFEKSNKKYNGLVLASLRREGEAARVHELGGKVVWVDADPKIRYERISGRGRGAEDAKTFKQFLEEEEVEMHNQGDKHAVGMAAVRDIADIMLTNNGNDIEAFKDNAEKALASYL
jgi:dephospho-CoA kinase